MAASRSNAAAKFKMNLASVNLEEPDEALSQTKITNSPALGNYAVKQIPFELLHPNRYQIQLRPEGLNKESLEELAQNITTNGFTSVILVRPHPELPGQYEIGHGHRRLAALKIAAQANIEPNKVAGWTKIPARIAEGASDSEWLDIAISENLSREDLTPLAIAASFQAIRTLNPGISLANIARRVGRSKAWVQRHDAINGAPEHLIKMIREKHDSLEHLFTLKSLPDESLQRELALQVLSGKLTLGALKEQIENQKHTFPKSKYTKARKEQDTTLQSRSRLSYLINQLENNIFYLNQQLERENYKLSFDQFNKLETLTKQLNELMSLSYAQPHKL